MSYKSILVAGSCITALSLLGCKNSGSNSSQVNSESDKIEYLNVKLSGMGMSTSQAQKSANSVAFKTFSINVDVRCETQNFKYTIKNEDSKNKLPYVIGEVCNFEFNSFELDKKTYNSVNKLKLQLKEDVITKSDDFGKYSNNTETIYANGSKKAGTKELGINIYEREIDIINDKNSVTNEQAKIIPFNTEGNVTVGKVSAPSEIKFYFSKTEQKAGSDGLILEDVVLDSMYTLKIKSDSIIKEFPRSNCYIDTVSELDLNKNNIVELEEIDAYFFNTDKVKTNCGTIDLNKDNNWRNYSKTDQVIIMANTHENGNSYRAVRINASIFLN